MGEKATATDWGYEAQRAAEAHLDACQEAEWEAEELLAAGGDMADAPESPASAPFCNCQTCVVREVLYAAWPVFEASEQEFRGQVETAFAALNSGDVAAARRQLAEALGVDLIG